MRSRTFIQFACAPQRHRPDATQRGRLFLLRLFLLRSLQTLLLEVGAVVLLQIFCAFDRQGQ
ncbi:MAG: hypothetical protein M3379_05325, partial [Acidobacteriota bacterium]|nr:hypothetical protein [Acidobacteriota bacterium]